MTPFGPDSPFGSVFRLAVPRRALVARVLEIVDQNAHRGEAPLQHVLLSGPQGSGKTVILSALHHELEGKRFSQRVAADFPAAIALQAAVPESLLEGVAATVQGETRTAGPFPWRTGDEPEWNAALVQLDEALDARFGQGRGMAVLLIDDFESVLRRVFPTQEAQSRLRRLLQDHPRLMLIAGTRETGLQSDYDRPLFQIFMPIELPPFGLSEARAFIRGDHGLAPRQTANLEAVYSLLGTGQPRRLLLTAHLAASTPSASALLRAMCDAESGTFEQTIDHLSSRPMRLLDALVAGGEPARPAELSRRLATQQSDIAPTLAALLQSGLLGRHQGSSGRMIFYQVEDRAFACWYAYSRNDAPALALDAADVLAAGLLPPEVEETVTRRGVAAAREALAQESRASAFKSLMSALPPPSLRSSDSKRVWQAACAELIRAPVDPRLLLDVVSTLRVEPAARTLAALLDAAALTPFPDAAVDADLARPLNLDKDRIAHPDALAAVRALRSETL